MPAATVTIDRLTVQFPGITPEEGRKLALQIAADLAAAGAMPAAGDFPVVRVEMAVAAKSNHSDLAARIVAEAIRQLRRGAG